jgi:hypothetical protein
LQNRKIEPEKISAPAVAIRSAIAAAMSPTGRYYYLEDRLDTKHWPGYRKPIINVPSKDCSRCPSYKGNSEIF